jgi:regulator of sirC expression with transglutaminase-like and TPR domain
MARADLTLFAHVVKRPEADLDLAQASLLIAEAEYPGLDVAHYIDLLDQLGAEARRRIGESPRSDAESETALRCLLRLLYEERGFRGNSEDYYDPRNSFLNDVLERRVGIPITLAVVVLEVAARAGITARGVSFPGHFLVRATGARGPLFVDPFDGGLAGPAELRALHARATGQEKEPDPRLLEPAPKAQVVLRMLNNLRSIYASRGDRDRLRAILERVEVLAPSDDVRRQIEQLGGGAPSATPPRPRTLN